MAFIACSVIGNVHAQQLPQTDLWLAAIEDGIPGKAIKINPTGGYNNQPGFARDGKTLFYTAEQKTSDGRSQTDIAACNIKESITSLVNHSPESEYSPTPIPGRNALSVIQVEPDNRQ